MDRDELKETFHRVTAYRHVCEAVRRTAGHTLFSGCFFIFIAVVIYQSLGGDALHPLFLFYAALAAFEVGVGLWKKFHPSVECVLADAINNFAFGGSIGVRYLLAMQGMFGPKPTVFSLVIAAWSLWDAWNSFQSYLQLRKAFVVRPTREQMRYVADMARDIQAADPNSDPTAIDLPSNPPIRALLVDDLAFLADPDGGDAIAIDREAIDIARHVSPDSQKAVGVLRLDGQSFPPFPLSDANWRNYCRWKGLPENA